jgi:hypothetical protein
VVGCLLNRSWCPMGSWFGQNRFASPFLSFAVESFSPLLCRDVVFCSPVILGGFPFAFDQSSPLQSLKGNKQGARVDAKNAFAHLFNPDGDSISMRGAPAPRFSE